MPVILIALWAGVEAGLTASDVADFFQTLSNPCADVWDKLLSGGGLLAGVGLPGGGYGKFAKGLRAARRAERAGDAERLGLAATSKIDRAAFQAERRAYWKAEAEANPGRYSTDDLSRMRNGDAPNGPDGYPVELHHVDGTPGGGIEPLSRTDHRLGPNYRENHPWLFDGDDQ